MWTAFLLFAALFVGASSSPYVAMLFLILATIGLSLKAGTLFSTWFFFTLVIVYLGGMMVMFVYLSSLVQSVKINLLGSQIVYISLGVLSSLGVLGSFNFFTEKEKLWVDGGISYSNMPLMLFMVLYLLVALLGVYRLCEKCEGPMKSL